MGLVDQDALENAKQLHLNSRAVILFVARYFNEKIQSVSNECIKRVLSVSVGHDSDGRLYH